MAFLEDVGKTIGQVAAGVTGAAQTVAESAQSTLEQAKLQREQTKANSDKSKCPGCGYYLGGMEAVCPMCGYQMRSDSDDDGSVEQFAKQLNKIEQRRNAVIDSLSKTLSGRTSDPTDERIAGLIRNYVVPNTKEGIFEFMLLAAGNIDAQEAAALQKRKGPFGTGNRQPRVRDGISEIVISAWLNKFEQTYQRAKISFGDDLDFKRIQDLYESKMAEIEAAKSRKWW